MLLVYFKSLFFFVEFIFFICSCWNLNYHLKIKVEDDDNRLFFYKKKQIKLGQIICVY